MYEDSILPCDWLIKGPHELEPLARIASNLDISPSPTNTTQNSSPLRMHLMFLCLVGLLRSESRVSFLILMGSISHRYEVKLDEKIGKIGFGYFSNVYNSKGTWCEHIVAPKSSYLRPCASYSSMRWRSGRDSRTLTS